MQFKFSLVLDAKDKSDWKHLSAGPSALKIPLGKPMKNVMASEGGDGWATRRSRAQRKDRATAVMTGEVSATDACCGTDRPFRVSVKMPALSLQGSRILKPREAREGARAPSKTRGKVSWRAVLTERRCPCG